MTARWGVTIPLYGMALPAQRKIIEELAGLGVAVVPELEPDLVRAFRDG